ncbi:LapA family protein [Kaarinaea lacus]
MTIPTNVKLITGLVLAALVLVFIIQNAAVVELHFLFWTLSMSRSLMILFVLFIGLVIGWIVGSHFQRKPQSEDKPVH